MLVHPPSARCAVESCERVQHARGFCERHYRRLLRYGNPLGAGRRGPAPQAPKICSVEGCDHPVDARGWCKSHYSNWRRLGHPVVERPAFDSFVEIDAASGCHVWTGTTNKAGYGQFEGTGAHRYAYDRAHPEAPLGALHCLHRCDNPPCVNEEHLYAGTHKDNNRDTRERGRFVASRGEDNAGAKITEAIVRDIRARYQKGNGGALAREYGLDHRHVWRIVHRLDWKHID